MKKSLRILCIMFVLFAAVSVTGRAETTEGGFIYEIYEDYAEIIGYSGAETDVNIPEELEGKPVRSIKEKAFLGLADIVSVQIPDSVKSIGNSAFGGCTGLNSITMPESAVDIGSSVFNHTAYYDNEENWSSGNVLYIGNHLIRAGLGRLIGEYPIGEYKVRPGTRSIAARAFSTCRNLTGIIIPKSVEIIGDGAFNSCVSLTDVIFNGSLERIGGEAFLGCYSLEEIDLPDGITGIEAKTFSGCKGIKRIHVPGGVTYIGEEAFLDCTSLKTAELPDSLISIDAGAFENCSSLKAVALPDGLTSIGDRAFAGCSAVTELYLPDSVAAIGNKAFNGCKALASVSGGQGINSIGESVLGGTVYYSNNDNYEDGALYVGTCLINGKKVSGDYTIKPGTRVIAPMAFYACGGITSVSVPKSLICIGQKAFTVCGALKDVYYEGSKAEWDNIFIDDGNLLLSRIALHFSGPSLTGLNVTVTDGSLAVTVEPADIPDGAILFAAAYDTDGGYITGAIMKDGRADLSAQSASLVKVFAWNSLSGLSPVCSAVEAKV